MALSFTTSLFNRPDPHLSNMLSVLSAQDLAQHMSKPPQKPHNILCISKRPLLSLLLLCNPFFELRGCISLHRS